MRNYIENTNFVLLSDDDYNWTCNHTFEELPVANSERWASLCPLFDDEVWKSASVCGLDNYFVSNYGRIYQKEYTYSYKHKNGQDIIVAQRHKIVSNILLTNGYYNAVLYIGHTKKNIYVHRIVCYLFNSLNRPKRFEFDKSEKYNIVDHTSTIKTNNIASQLVWSSYKDNMNNAITKKKMSDSKQNTKVNRQKRRFNYYEGTPEDNFSDYVQNESSRYFSLVDFKDEVWKRIPNHRYAFVSSFGRIKKCFNNREDMIYIPYYTLNNNGYYCVYLGHGPELVHRVIYKEFFGEIEPDKIIDHIDTNRLNNSITNLRAVTFSQNSNNTLSVQKNKHHREVSNCRPVVLYSLETGKRIREYTSQMKCATDLNTKMRGLGSTPDKVYIIQKKYVAVFKDMEQEFIENRVLDELLIKKIDKYDLSGNYIKTFDSAYDIVNSNVRRKHIYKCCTGKQVSAYGYIWRWHQS